MSFVKFTRSRAVRSVPVVSISDKGIIGFNDAARQLYNMAENPFISFYFDQSTRCVGFRFDAKPSADAYKLTLRKTGAYARGKNILESWGIGCAFASRHFLHPLNEEDEEAVCFIEINNPMKGGGGNG